MNVNVTSDPGLTRLKGSSAKDTPPWSVDDGLAGFLLGVNLDTACSSCVILNEGDLSRLQLCGLLLDRSPQCLLGLRTLTLLTKPRVMPRKPDRSGLLLGEGVSAASMSCGAAALTGSLPRGDGATALELVLPSRTDLLCGPEEAIPSKSDLEFQELCFGLLRGQSLLPVRGWPAVQGQALRSPRDLNVLV